MQTNLKKFLENNKITITEFAKKLGYKKPHISQIANGKKLPSLQLALKIQRETNGYIRVEDFENIPELSPTSNKDNQ